MSGSASPTRGSTGFQPYGLTTELLENPRSIDVHVVPRFGWKLRSDRRGDRQVSYRLVVGAGPRLTGTERRLSTGFVVVGLLCPELSRRRRDDLAYALVLQQECPSWLHSMRRGATTVWERWDGWTEEYGFQSPRMNSFNHYSFGLIGEWFYGGVAGIQQARDSVAYRDLELRAAVSVDLTQAHADQETVRGRVSAAGPLR